MLRLSIPTLIRRPQRSHAIVRRISHASALRLDPEYEAIFEKALKTKKSMPKPALGDVYRRRTAINGYMSAFFQAISPSLDVSSQDFSTTGPDGQPISLRWYRPKDQNRSSATLSSAFVYLHGGGLIAGSVEAFDPILRGYVSMSSVPVLAVGYHPAPEGTAPGFAEGTLAAIQWLHKHASDPEVMIDPARIGVMGDSGGGGIAAAAAVLARDRGLQPPLAKQILLYPMLDDRTVTLDKHLEPFTMWNQEDNVTAWSAALGTDPAGLAEIHSTGTAVSPYAAAARVETPTGLPPLYMDVGELDMYANEDIQYAERLRKSGISVELHVFPGCPHAFDGMLPSGNWTRTANAFRVRAMRSI